MSQTFMSQTIKKFLLIAFIILNTIPMLGGLLLEWPQADIHHIYWWEGAIVVSIVLMFHYTKHLVVFFSILLMSAAVISLRDASVWHDLRVPATFWGLFSACWLLYFDLCKTPFGLRIRSLHPLKYFFVYLSFLTVAVLVSFSLTASIYHGWDLVMEVPLGVYATPLALAAIIPTLSIGALKIINMIGARHVLDYLLGTYYRPKEKEQVVLFLDMVGSSAIAEKLKPKESMALIAQFIFDASYVFRLHGGDISNYTGDGLVVLWPINKADNALTAVIALKKRIHKNAPAYIDRFGIVPEFRVGMHAGEVVVSQIGEEKLFLGIYGDTVNTAARLEQLNKETATHLLFSQEVEKRLTTGRFNGLVDLGAHAISGKNRRVTAFTLEGWQLGEIEIPATPAPVPEAHAPGLA